MVKAKLGILNYRTRNRMHIYAHEDFLPSNAIKATAVVFEFDIPKPVAAYRNATWMILMMAYPTPTKLLGDYDPLTAYASGHSTGITIASISKSFRGTHYKVSKKGMKASESNVLCPN